MRQFLKVCRRPDNRCRRYSTFRCPFPDKETRHLSFTHQCHLYPSATIPTNSTSMSEGNANPRQNVAPSFSLTAGAVPARPYRSHRIPACDFCHRRKSRCDRTRLDEPCTLCRVHKKQCVTRTTAHVRRPAKPDEPRESPAQLNSTTTTPENSLTSNCQDADMELNRPRRDATLVAAATGLSSHIVGPAVAPDVQMLEQYLSPRETGGAVSHVHPNPYSVYSDDPRNPVVYLKVPRQRTTTATGNGTSGFKQCEIIENILHPLGPNLIELSVACIHPVACHPVLTN